MRSFFALDGENDGVSIPFLHDGWLIEDLADQAMEMRFRSSRGVLRVASKTLRTAMRLAAERGQSFLDEATVQAAVDELGAST